MSHTATSAGPEEQSTAHVVKRIGGLDGLRGVGSLSVLLFHCLPQYFPGGYFALDMFFVVSGYIISVTLLKEHALTGTISIAGFYRRRALRILPTLLAVVAGVLMLGWFVGDAWAPHQPRREEWIEAAMAITSTMNWFAAFGESPRGFLGHTWSISLEEQFYFLWPLALLLLLHAKRVRSIAAVLLGLTVICFTWRAYLTWTGATPERLYLASDTRFDALMLGCLLAVIGTASVPHALRRWWPIPASALFLLLLLSSWRQPWLGFGGFTVVALLSVWLVAAAVEGESMLARFLELKPVQWLGVRSYSLYLWQVPMIGVVGLLALPRLYTPIGIFILSLIAAEISYRLFERPFLRRRTDGPRDRRPTKEGGAANPIKADESPSP